METRGTIESLLDRGRPLVPPLNPVQTLPAVNDSCPEVWLDNDGSPVAFGSLGEYGSIEFPGHARFAFHVNGGPVHVASLSASGDWIEDAYYRSVLPLVLQARGIEALHASAVETSCGVVAFAAVSGTGKSTLAAALAGAGYPAWADDVVIWRREDCGSVSAIPAPFRIKAGAQPLASFALAPGDRTLAAICLLERVPPEEPISVTAGHGTDVFTGLLRHAYCFSLRDQERKRAMMSHYMELSSSVPVCVVRYPTGYDRLPEVIERLKFEVLHTEP